MGFYLALMLAAFTITIIGAFIAIVMQDTEQEHEEEIEIEQHLKDEKAALDAARRKF